MHPDPLLHYDNMRQLVKSTVFVSGTNCLRVLSGEVFACRGVC